MNAIVDIIVPVFGLVLVGWAIGRTRLLSPEGDGACLVAAPGVTARARLLTALLEMAGATATEPADVRH